MITSRQVYFFPKKKRFRFFKKAYQPTMWYRGNYYVRVGEL